MHGGGGTEQRSEEAVRVGTGTREGGLYPLANGNHMGEMQLESMRKQHNSSVAQEYALLRVGTGFLGQIKMRQYIGTQLLWMLRSSNYASMPTVMW